MIIIIIIIIINDVITPFVRVFGWKVEKHISFILNVNLFSFFKAKIVLFTEQDYGAWALLLILNCFFKVSYKDNWNETLILLCKEFDNNTHFLSLLNNHNAFDGKTTIFKISDTIQHNINFKKTLEKIKNYFVHATHFYNSLEEICYDVLEFICLNVSAISRFCTLTKEGCVIDTEKEVIKQLRDGNYKYTINKPSLWEWIRKKCNVYVPQNFQSILVCALTVLLEHPEYDNFIGVASILKGTYFGKVNFINTFLMDFFVLLYISEYSGKTMEECNVMVIKMGRSSDAVSDNDYSSDSKAQLHLNFQKKIY